MKEYNSELDEIVWEKKVQIGNAFSKSPFKQMFLVRVMKYDNGKPKLEIKRLSYGRGNEGSFLKTGRFTKDELSDLLPVIQEAMNLM